MPLLDLSPCCNLRTLRMDQELASLPESESFLQTISSVHFEKLVIGPNPDETAGGFSANDRVFRLFAERLYGLGAKKPLTMALEFLPTEEGKDGQVNAQRILPLFCEAGVVVKDYSGRYW